MIENAGEKWKRQIKEKREKTTAACCLATSFSLGRIRHAHK